jgi:rhamnose transport system permease protein
LIALVLGWFLVHQSRFGREIRALGGNPNAAKYVGIPETRRLFVLYALSGVVAGVVGVLWVARFALANTDIASGFELQVVAACVLGGVSIAGGIGSVLGTALGAIFLTTLYNALPVINVSKTGGKSMKIRNWGLCCLGFKLQALSSKENQI